MRHLKFGVLTAITLFWLSHPLHARADWNEAEYGAHDETVEIVITGAETPEEANAFFTTNPHVEVAAYTGYPSATARITGRFYRKFVYTPSGPRMFDVAAQEIVQGATPEGQDPNPYAHSRSAETGGGMGPIEGHCTGTDQPPFYSDNLSSTLQFWATQDWVYVDVDLEADTHDLTGWSIADAIFDLG